MFAPPTRAVAAALYRKVEEESEEFSSRLTTHAANNNMSLNRLENLYIVQLNIKEGSIILQDRKMMNIPGS